MIKKFALATAALALATAPALAGSPEPVAEEPVIVAPAPASPDWTGFYVGGQVGYAWADTSNPVLVGVLGSGGIATDGDGWIGGIIAGYDWDLGDWVVGVGADYDWADVDLTQANPANPLGTPAANLEEIWRLKARGGYKIGNGLLYGTAGYADASTDNLGSNDGYFIGAGYDHLITEQFSVGAELLYHDFGNFNNAVFSTSQIDVDATTLQVRGAFRF